MNNARQNKKCHPGEAGLNLGSPSLGWRKYTKLTFWSNNLFERWMSPRRRWLGKHSASWKSWEQQSGGSDIYYLYSDGNLILLGGKMFKVQDSQKKILPHSVHNLTKLQTHDLLRTVALGPYWRLSLGGEEVCYFSRNMTPRRFYGRAIIALGKKETHASLLLHFLFHPWFVFCPKFIHLLLISCALCLNFMDVIPCSYAWILIGLHKKLQQWIAWGMSLPLLNNNERGKSRGGHWMNGYRKR